MDFVNLSFFFALFLCYCSENLRGKLEDFCHFFTVNFHLILSPNQFFLWCRSTVGTSTQTRCKNRGNSDNVSCVKDV